MLHKVLYTNYIVLAILPSWGFPIAYRHRVRYWTVPYAVPYVLARVPGPLARVSALGLAVSTGPWQRVSVLHLRDLEVVPHPQKQILILMMMNAYEYSYWYQYKYWYHATIPTPGRGRPQTRPGRHGVAAAIKENNNFGERSVCISENRRLKLKGSYLE